MSAALAQALGLAEILRGDPELGDLAEQLSPLLAELRVRAGLLAFAEVPREYREGDFEVWWAGYPKKVGKKDARRVWMAAKGMPLLATLLACLEAQKATQRWQDGFIPDPVTYLRGERWNDDPSTMGRGGRADDAPPPQYDFTEDERRRWKHLDKHERSLILENFAVDGWTHGRRFAAEPEPPWEE